MGLRAMVGRPSAEVEARQARRPRQAEAAATRQRQMKSLSLGSRVERPGRRPQPPGGGEVSRSAGISGTRPEIGYGMT